MRKSVLKSKKVILAAVIILLVLASVVTGIIVNGSSVARNISEKLKLGEKYLTEMKYEEAIVAFEEVISIEPRNMEAYLGLADAYLGLGQPDNAVKSLERGVKVVKQAKEEKSMIENSDTLFIKEYEILISMDKIDEAVEKLKEGYSVTESEKIKDILEQYQPTVESSLPEGEYSEAQSVELTSNGINIYYTTDGSEPTKASERYQEQIALTNGKTVMKAVAEGKNNYLGEVVEFTYDMKLPGPVLSSEERDTIQLLYQALADENFEEASKYAGYYCNIHRSQEEFMKADNILRQVDAGGYSYDGVDFYQDYDGVGLVNIHIASIEDKERYSSYAYYGDISMGVADGYGVSIYHIVEEIYGYYKGQWKNGLPNGEGDIRIVINSGDIIRYRDYHGFFDNGRLMDGTISYSEGDTLINVNTYEGGLVQSSCSGPNNDTIERSLFPEAFWVSADHDSYTEWGPAPIQE